MQIPGRGKARAAAALGSARAPPRFPARRGCRYLRAAWMKASETVRSESYSSVPTLPHSPCTTLLRTEVPLTAPDLRTCTLTGASELCPPHTRAASVFSSLLLLCSVRCEGGNEPRSALCLVFFGCFFSEDGGSGGNSCLGGAKGREGGDGGIEVEEGGLPPHRTRVVYPRGEKRSRDHGGVCVCVCALLGLARPSPHVR